MPSNSSKAFNDKHGIFSYYNNKISASPAKSTSNNEISSHLKKSPLKRHDAQAPEGGMVIYYSPDAGCISNSKFNSESELQKFKNLSISSDYESSTSNKDFNFNLNDKMVKRPMPFVKALEITNKLDQSKQAKNENSDNRQSQYEMNYEISV